MPPNGRPPPNNGMGRPKGALGKATRWKKELAFPGMNLELTPTQILAANMQYFQGKAEDALKSIADAQKQGIPVSEFGREMDYVIKYKQLANDTANLLAPYVHSKMPTLVVQPDQEAQQYVIRVPDALPDGKAWSHAITDAKTIEQ